MATPSSLSFRDECHVEPWNTPRGTVLLVHGVGESHLAWLPWVPAFSRKYRVLIPDLPGCGDSPARNGVSKWSMEALADVLFEFVDRLAITNVHLVGAKFGGTLALTAAARHPNQAQTLTVLDVHVNSHNTTGTVSARDTIRREGLRKWAADSMRARLGSGASSRQLSWWTDFMASSDIEATLALMGATDALNLEPIMANIKAPTLMLTARDSPVTSIDAAERWASLVPRASLQIIEGDAYHIAAAYPDLVALRVRQFIDENS